MSERERWIEQRYHELAREMPDMFPDGFAKYLAELEWEEAERDAKLITRTVRGD